MRTLLLALAALVLPYVTHAQTCTVPSPDLSIAIRSLAGSPAVLLTNRSSAAIPNLRRYSIDFSDGSLFVLEQQDCTNSELRITVLSKNPTPSSIELRRMGMILNAAPAWRANFPSVNVTDILLSEVSSPTFRDKQVQSPTGFAYSINSILSSNVRHSETALASVSGPAGLQFRSFLTLSIKLD